MTMHDITQMSQAQRLEHLFKAISSPRFLRMEGLGNEVPFFICPFEPAKATDMGKLQRQLANRLEQAGLRILEINLYDLAAELLKARNIWDRVLQLENTISKDELLELLQGVLDPRAHVIPAIAKKLSIEPCDVLLIFGVGEVFPYIRSHNILNNLQSTAKDQPTVLFFPGTYTHSLEKGASLDLFGLLHDDKYYRAFNIYHYEV